MFLERFSGFQPKNQIFLKLFFSEQVKFVSVYTQGCSKHQTYTCMYRTNTFQYPAIFFFNSYLRLRSSVWHTNGLPVYGVSESDLTSIQNFLDRCYKRRFISYPILINDLLNKQGCRFFQESCLCRYSPALSLHPPKKTAHTISEMNNLHVLK